MFATFLSKHKSETLIALAASHQFSKPCGVTIDRKDGVLTNHIRVYGGTHPFGENHPFTRKQTETMVNNWLETLGNKNQLWVDQSRNGSQYGKIVVHGTSDAMEKTIRENIREYEAGPSEYVEKNFTKKPCRNITYCCTLGGKRFYVLSHTK